MDPQSLCYRSPVYRYLRDLDAEFAEINGYAVATSIGDAAAQLAAGRILAICDLSGLARMGIKGAGIGRWLSAQELSVPEEPNRALRQNDGSLMAMLADNEALILADIEQSGRHIDRLTGAFGSAGDLPDMPAGLVVPRQHGLAWFRITGHEMAPTLAKVCAVDLRPAFFDDLRVAQTSIARLTAIVIRDDIGDVPALHLLVDSASAAYFWECILDAGAEYDMRVVGLRALQDLSGS